MTCMKIWEVYENYGRNAWIEAIVMNVGDSIDIKNGETETITRITRIDYINYTAQIAKAIKQIRLNKFITC